jgi:hypothetical protein
VAETWRRGNWVEVSEVKYTGRIVRVAYRDGGDAYGDAYGRTAKIYTEQEAVATFLRRRFTEDDGELVDTGLNIIM